MTSRNTLTLMLMGLAVLLFASASDISAAGTGAGGAVDTRFGAGMDQDRSGVQGRMQNVIFGWFESDDKDKDEAKKDADRDIPTVDQDRATPERKGAMDGQPGIDRDITRDADPGASPKNPMDMDMGTADRNMGVESDADTDIPAERQPGATTDNLMNRAAFDQALEQDQDVKQENLPIDQDRSLLDQNQDQSILDQDRDQDQSVLPDQDSTVTSPEMSTTDRDGMGIVR